MKIGILTLPFNNNYGGFLQEYALMTVLKRMGHDVWFIDLRICPQQSILEIHRIVIKRLIKKYLFRKKVPIIIPSREIRHNELNGIIAWQYTRPFVDKYLCPKISPIYSSEELSYLIDKFNFDAFIAGSDQIWRPQFMGYLLKTAYFDFLKGRKEKRISYAASFGSDEWEYTPVLTNECTELIKEFNAVSVREESGVILCKKHLNVEAQWVLDPTMLLSKNDYINLIKDAKIELNKGELFCYMLDKTNEKQEIINTVSKQLALMPFYMGLKKKEKNIENNISESIESWLRGFYDAKFVITDSFHGMVFSIIFNKPFLCLVNEWRGVARFVSLARQFRLEDRLLYEKNWLNKDSFSTINWLEINNILEVKRRESMLFLEQVLN
jgi:hypothetical protein